MFVIYFLILVAVIFLYYNFYYKSERKETTKIKLRRDKFANNNYKNLLDKKCEYVDVTYIDKHHNKKYICFTKNNFGLTGKKSRITLFEFRDNNPKFIKSYIKSKNTKLDINLDKLSFIKSKNNNNLDNIFLLERIKGENRYLLRTIQTNKYLAIHKGNIIYTKKKKFAAKLYLELSIKRQKYIKYDKS